MWSPKTGTLLKPTHSHPPEGEWEDTYILQPGTYVAVVTDVAESGEHRCRMYTIAPSLSFGFAVEIGQWLRGVPPAANARSCPCLSAWEADSRPRKR